MEIQMLKLIPRLAPTKGESWRAGSFSRNPSFSWLDRMGLGMQLRVCVLENGAIESKQVSPDLRNSMAVAFPVPAMGRL